MKGLAIAPKGFEDICASEIKEIIGEKTEKPSLNSGFVLFEFSKFEQLFKICYKSQSASRVCLVLDSFQLEKLESAIKKIDFSKWLSKEEFFGVECERSQERQEIIQDASNAIAEITGAKPTYKNPALTFVVAVSDEDNKDDVHLCIDFSGAELGRRDYRIFLSGISLKGNIAYCLLRAAGYELKKSLLDPFCRSGAIPIEAALSSCEFPVRHYSKHKFPFLKLKPFRQDDFDKFFKKEDEKINLESKTLITALDSNFASVQAAQKNAKIAGMIKKINFSRIELKWLDTKFKKNGIDLVITIPIQPSKSIAPSVIEKVYKEFFYQMEFMLAKGGKAALAVREGPAIEILKKHATEYKFSPTSERSFAMGKEPWQLIIFETKK